MNNRIYIPVKGLKKWKQEERPVIRVTSEAYQTLIDLTDKSGMRMVDLASTLIMEAAKLVEFEDE